MKRPDLTPAGKKQLPPRGLHPWQAEAVTIIKKVPTIGITLDRKNGRPTRQKKAAAFYKLVVSLWGEDWRPRLNALITQHRGKPVSKQTLWNWRTGNRSIPDDVEAILRAERQNRRRA